MFYRQVAEVINGFAQDIPAISFVGGNLRHGKISLTQHNSLGIDTRLSIKSWTLVLSQTNGRWISGMAISPDLTQLTMFSMVY